MQTIAIPDVEILANRIVHSMALIYSSTSKVEKEVSLTG